MIKKMTEEKLREVIPQAISIAEVLKKLEMSVTTANYRTFHKMVKTFALDTSHFLGHSYLKSGRPSSQVRSLEDILVKESTYLNIAQLKKRLFDKGLLQYECYECKIDSWRGKPISLQLDHVNGIHNDHRLENLRLMCPNCHSQTSNFAGKNKGSAFSES